MISAIASTRTRFRRHRFYASRYGARIEPTANAEAIPTDKELIKS
jgi:hypothetical protein